MNYFAGWKTFCIFAIANGEKSVCLKNRSVMLPCTWEPRKFSSGVIKVVLRLRVNAWAVLHLIIRVFLGPPSTM